MDGLLSLAADTTGLIPDVYLDGVPYQVTAGLTYWLLRHHAACGAKVTLPAWVTSWEHLGDRLGARWGVHAWHPSHWDGYYETMVDVPASTPGSMPLTMAMVRERRKEKQAQLALLALEEARGG